ncbi:hypothetical protein LCI18_011074 [Fusarium solani-melongenae]|uniref:Uncharacterized protein n=1 Tax=Fusarium solani subsp. cucurbitae TaxID=2747967 RepID=A0ACD3ZFS5_FUSSC|nr:hypothetical protein LCI18_011074 [Fusarium solani-melongenae]
MLLYDALGINTCAVRLFILERGHVSLDVKQIDVMTMKNRKPAYVKNVHSRGTLPALRISDDFVLTEITAIAEYLDEIASDGASLFGTTALERAETRMWLRRADLEICEPVTSYYRNDPDTVDFYRGNRIPCPEARLWQKVNICQALNRFDDELEDKKWLCGDRFSAADIHFYGLMKPMCTPVPFLNDSARKNLAAWWERMDNRPASKKSLECFAEGWLDLSQ